MHDLRHEYPYPGAGKPSAHRGHRAEINIHIVERLLHALADADTRDREGRLTAHDEVDVCAGNFEPADKRHIIRYLHSAFDDAVGADAEIHGVLVLICAAERAQLDGGIQNDGVDRFVRQVELELL